MIDRFWTWASLAALGLALLEGDASAEGKGAAPSPVKITAKGVTNLGEVRWLEKEAAK